MSKEISRPAKPAVDLAKTAVDLNILDELAEDLGETFAEFMELLLEQMPLRLQRLRAAIEQGDAGLACEAAHSIKSSAGYVGARQLMQLGAEIERCARAGELHGTRELAEQADAQYEQVRLLLTQRL
ncbi:MAG: Hpt domain-containing protein [Gammaproteobacteria bacterium]|nr:Hpt domain-containing protein [Gammaproteobacteria bacterium]